MSAINHPPANEQEQLDAPCPPSFTTTGIMMAEPASLYSPDYDGGLAIAFPTSLTMSPHCGNKKRTLTNRSDQDPGAHYNNGHEGKKKGAPGTIGALPPEDRSASTSITQQHQLQLQQEEREQSAYYYDKENDPALPFVQKTFDMINKCHIKHPDLARWTKDGNMFVIKDKDTFSTKIIPQYFDHNKFGSFVRQLNFYGFRKLTSKVNKSSKHVTFKNVNFRRDRSDLLKKIKRHSNKESKNTEQIQEEQQREIQFLQHMVGQLTLEKETMQQELNNRLVNLETQVLQLWSLLYPQEYRHSSTTIASNTTFEQNQNDAINAQNNWSIRQNSDSSWSADDFFPIDGKSRDSDN